MAFHPIAVQETKGWTREEGPKRGLPRVFYFLLYMAMKRSITQGSFEADDAFCIRPVRKACCQSGVH